MAERSEPQSAGIVDSQSVKTTGVGGQERGFDPAKKVDGRKRHLLVDTEGLVLKACLHSATVPDQDGIRLLCWSTGAGPLCAPFSLVGRGGLPGEGQEVGPRGDGLECGSRAQAARKPVPEKVAEAWAREWAREWAKAVDWRSLMPPRGFRVLPRRWVVERTFAHLRAPSRG